MARTLSDLQWGVTDSAGNILGAFDTREDAERFLESQGPGCWVEWMGA